MAADASVADVTDDAVLGGRLKLLQPREGHRVGHDAILLAAATPACAGEHGIDLGAGVGAAGLALAHRVPGLRLTLVEIDEQLVRLAAENARRNGLADRVRAVALDVDAPARDFAAAGLPAGSADIVLLNPPFNDPLRHRVSPMATRRRAHVASQDELARWLACATRLLRTGGSLTMIVRTEALGATLASFGASFGGTTVLPVYPKADAAAIRVIIAAVKGSRAPLQLVPGLVLHEADGRGTVQAEAVLRHGATLPLAAKMKNRERR
jgi:tRNA1(Val) A37 N6-methylase TrmN6